jgi:hypothetical protein
MTATTELSLDNDLTELTTPDLDNMLRYLYGKHKAQAKDDRLATHMAILHILAEQSRRHDDWLAGLPT